MVNLFTHTILFHLVILLFGFASLLDADQIRFDTAQEWRQWKIPFGIVELNPSGTITPIAINKDTNAAIKAQQQGGGIHSVSSNPGDATMVLDGDLSTGWSPNLDGSTTEQFIEIDLGRGISAYRVQLIFSDAAPPFELFELMLSTGEHKIDQVGNPIEDSIVYRITERYKKNRRHHITFELDHPLHTPIRFIRIEVLNTSPDARLDEI